MIITFIIASLWATMVLWGNPRNSSLRWLSASFYAIGFSALNFFIVTEFSTISPYVRYMMVISTDAAIAYTFGMFCVVYSGIVEKQYSRVSMIGGISLFVLVFFLTSFAHSIHNNYIEHIGLPMYLFMSIHLLVGMTLLLISSYQEKNPFKKIERFLTNLLVVPVMFWIFVCYSFQHFWGIDLLQYNYVAAILFFILYSVVGINKGALGIKIKIELLKNEASLNVLQSTSSIINHTIKNEIGKVDIILDHLKHTIHENPQPNSVELEKAIDSATDSIHHINAMVSKIQEGVRTINVSMQKERLLLIVEECLDQVEKAVGMNVSVKRNFTIDPIVQCDAVHIKEVIQNIISNAIEAMDYRGEITVNILEEKEYIIIQIQDTGAGITKEDLPNIFDPFYSTKSMEQSYGLGLFYCKNVMLVHCGSIHVGSVQGKGTIFTLRLPK